MTEVDAVVFVVDSNDAKRHDEARDVRAEPSRLALPPPALPPRSRLHTRLADRAGLRLQELHKVVGQQGVEGAPIMILCNKMDIPTAKGIAEMEEALGMRDLLRRRAGGLTQLFPCSLVRGEGLEEAMKWVGDAV